MKGIAATLFLSCRKAGELIEKSHQQPLHFHQKLQMHFHLKICDACKEYQRQSLLLEKLFQKRMAEAEIPESDWEKFRDGILNKL
jgi:hypothetical protein